MNPHATQLDSELFPPADRNSAGKMRSLYNERIIQVADTGDELRVIFHAKYGQEKARGIRICTFTRIVNAGSKNNPYAWQFKSEQFVATPDELQSRKGHHADAVRSIPRKRSTKCVTVQQMRMV